MSIPNEIQRIEQNIANTYTVLSALGADLPTNQTSDNLAATAGTTKVVLYSEQNLTDTEKEQARENIGALGTDELNSAIEAAIGNINTETWTFTLEDGSTVTKKVLIG